MGLSGADKEYNWAPDDCVDAMEEDDDKDTKVKPSHRLLVKMAILMPTAKKDEVSIIQVESEGYNKKKVVVPICAMKDLQKYVDLLIPGPAKLTLLQGEGPIYLAGSHCVDFFGFKDGAAESEDEDEATADEEDAEAEVAKEGGDERSTPSKDKKDTPTKEDSGSKKRKASTDPKSAEKKKK